jgi:hypothetical protein
MNIIFDDDSKRCNAFMRKRKDKDWIEALSKIEDENVRICAACVAFFDFTSTDLSTKRERMTKLHDIVKLWTIYIDNKVSQPVLQLALEQIGYSKQYAKTRSTGEQNG